MNTSYNIGKSFLRAVILLSGFLLTLSCSKADSLDGISASEASGTLPIRWDAYMADEFESIPGISKALIEEYSDLRNACTDLEGSLSEKIGVYGSYSLEGTEVTAFDNVDLWWWNKEDGNPFNDINSDKSYWNYPGDDVYWVEDAIYSFKAYFPKSKVTPEPGSDSERLLAVYDSQVSQYDLMVAGKTLYSKAENPVILLFRHTLAALKFNFRFKDEGITDYLTACWLENTGNDGLYTSCTLNYKDDISWPESTPEPVGSKMYLWKPSSPMPIVSDASATAYSSSSFTGNGNLYTSNDGWLLVIPQSCPGPEALQLCFTTTTGGDVVYRAGLPATEFLPGKRYTYNINISSTQIELRLGIADWNERDSSHEIDFNN